MRRSIGWLLFAVGGAACLLGMLGLAGFVGLPLELAVVTLETDAQLIDWLVVWLVVWAVGLFLLAGKKSHAGDSEPG